MVFFFFIIYISCSQEIPKVVDNTIYFLDGRTQIQIEGKDYYHLFPSKNRLIYINNQLKSNYREYTIVFYDFYGTKIAEPDTIYGEMRFYFYELNERVLAGQFAVLTKQNESYLYDLDGNLIKVLVHDYYTKQIGITEDKKYLWFAANKQRLPNPGEEPTYPYSRFFLYSHIMIFDLHSGDYVEEYSTLESPFLFILEGKSYSIPISPPDFPG
jgi:hypothetical protein